MWLPSDLHTHLRFHGMWEKSSELEGTGRLFIQLFLQTHLYGEDLASSRFTILHYLVSGILPPPPIPGTDLLEETANLLLKILFISILPQGKENLSISCCHYLSVLQSSQTQQCLQNSLSRLTPNWILTVWASAGEQLSQSNRSMPVDTSIPANLDLSQSVAVRSWRGGCHQHQLMKETSS